MKYIRAIIGGIILMLGMFSVVGFIKENPNNSGMVGTISLLICLYGFVVLYTATSKNVNPLKGWHGFSAFLSFGFCFLLLISGLTQVEAISIIVGSLALFVFLSDFSILLKKN